MTAADGRCCDRDTGPCFVVSATMAWTRAPGELWNNRGLAMAWRCHRTGNLPLLPRQRPGRACAVRQRGISSCAAGRQRQGSCLRAAASNPAWPAEATGAGAYPAATSRQRPLDILFFGSDAISVATLQARALQTLADICLLHTAGTTSHSHSKSQLTCSTCAHTYTASPPHTPHGH